MNSEDEDDFHEEFDMKYVGYIISDDAPTIY